MGSKNTNLKKKTPKKMKGTATTRTKKVSRTKQKRSRPTTQIATKEPQPIITEETTSPPYEDTVEASEVGEELALDNTETISDNEGFTSPSEAATEISETEEKTEPNPI